MRLFLVLFSVFALAACWGSLCLAGDPPPRPSLPLFQSDPVGRVVVVFNEGVSPACARSIVEARSMTILHEHEALHEHSGRVFFYLVSNTLTSEEMVRDLKKDSRVHTVKEESTLSIPPDPHLPGMK